MPSFKYKAITREGRTVRGRIEAANNADLELRLQRMELEPIRFRESSAAEISMGAKKITRRDLITFCYHMEQLARSGVPIIEGLVDLRDSMDNPRFKEVLAAVIQNIENGKNLSRSLADFPKVFDEVFTQLIAAGEESGKLPDVLKNITENLKWQDELAAQTKRILMYPAFVGVVVLSVVFFLMIYLVPQLVSFIKTMGHELPLHTRLLMATSNLFVHYWHIILVLPVVVFFTIRIAAKRSEEFRYRLDGLKLKVLFVGPILRKIILTRFANYFALLYASGITIINCMQIVERISGNLVIERALAQARAKITEGNSISSSMESVKLFPPLVVRMLKVGESTGALDSALLNISYFYNRDVNESIGKVQSMIEPVMTVILGFLLLWVMMSVLGPIYEIVSKIKA